MATLEMQSTVQLAESRRKMQARRRMKNRIALTLSMATMVLVCSGWSGSCFLPYHAALMACLWRCSLK
ncbi:hypothetical protein CWS02_26570 [Enterobacter sp. EA-1]|nr:hypothetical protein CWS02_26570 [Enterobacter sp. EA-1]